MGAPRQGSGVRGSPEKQKDYHHHQDKGDDEGRLHVLDAVDDGPRPIVNRRDAYRPGQFRTDHRQQITYALCYFHSVGAGLAKNRDDDGGRRNRITSEPEPHVDPLVLD